MLLSFKCSKYLQVINMCSDKCSVKCRVVNRKRTAISSHYRLQNWVTFPSCQDCRTLMLLKRCLRQWMTGLGAHRCRFRTVSFRKSDDKMPLMEFCFHQPDFTCVVIHLQDQRWAGSISVAAKRQELPQVPWERKCPVSKKKMWYLAVQGCRHSPQ